MKKLICHHSWPLIVLFIPKACFILYLAILLSIVFQLLMIRQTFTWSDMPDFVQRYSNWDKTFFLKALDPNWFLVFVLNVLVVWVTSVLIQVLCLSVLTFCGAVLCNSLSESFSWSNTAKGSDRLSNYIDFTIQVHHQQLLRKTWLRERKTMKWK